MLSHKKPDFFIVGGAKCGTTALHTYLKQHPQIFLPNTKEPHFFGSDLRIWRNVTTEQAYLALFKDAHSGMRIGESSVWYLYSKKAAYEIKNYCGIVDIIIMLRNPVDVMYSLHNHKLYRSLEDIVDFGEALKAESYRKNGKRLPHNSTNYPDTLFYSEVVLFADQVSRYFDVFGREKVHIILYDDFKARTADIYRETLQFLNVSPDFEAQIKPININKQARSIYLQRLLISSPAAPIKRLQKTPLFPVLSWMRNQFIRLNTMENHLKLMDMDLRHQLLAELSKEVKRLESLINRDLSMWIG